eukprot:5162923-Pleurochrysis_carterae.AAC.1
MNARLRTTTCAQGDDAFKCACACPRARLREHRDDCVEDLVALCEVGAGALDEDVLRVWRDARVLPVDNRRQRQHAVGRVVDHLRRAWRRRCSCAAAALRVGTLVRHERKRSG